MPRKKDIDERTALFLRLPQSMRGRVDLHLYSELEGCVPRGKYREFFMSLLTAFFNGKQLDLQPFGYPPGYAVRGEKAVIEELERRMKSGGQE